MMILKSFDVFSYEYCRYTTFMYNTYYNSRPISLSYISCAGMEPTDKHYTTSHYRAPFRSTDV